MINVGFYYSVLEGHEHDFENRFLQVVRMLKAGESGIRDAKLYRELGQNGEYMIFTEWDSVDHFRKFTESMAFRNTTEEGKKILKSHPRHIVLRAESP
jgi:heme-degrading monooxygenase HmoA